MIDATTRLCLRDPIPEITEAARTLDEAVSAHLRGDSASAEHLIRSTNTPILRDFIESMWGANSPHVRVRPVALPLPSNAPTEKVTQRMPSAAEKQALHDRDGYNCRFCGIPVIRKEVRVKIAAVYPTALPWGRQNALQHAAFQVLWAQYDHVIPHAHGGTNDPSNMVVACAACNYARVAYTLEEVGLSDPRLREPVRSNWDGLERFTRVGGTSKH